MTHKETSKLASYTCAIPLMSEKSLGSTWKVTHERAGSVPEVHLRTMICLITEFFLYIRAYAARGIPRVQILRLHTFTGRAGMSVRSPTANGKSAPCVQRPHSGRAAGEPAPAT